MSAHTPHRAFNTVLLDARLQSLAGYLGGPRLYFDGRDYLRSKVRSMDTAQMRAKGAIFVHVPKCAGTTIIRQVPISAWHFSAALVRRCDPDLWDSAFSFGFVRNPHDRLLSAFHYARSDKVHPRARPWVHANMREFADFAAFLQALEHRRARARLLSWLTFTPQTYFLCDRNDRILVDYVGRTERFGDDLAVINTRVNLGLENRFENKVDRPAGQSVYTPRGARLVEEIYAADFATFGYPTGTH